MSGYLQRLVDGAGAVPAAAGSVAVEAVPTGTSGSPIARFDQRLNEPEFAANFGLLSWASPSEDFEPWRPDQPAPEEGVLPSRRGGRQPPERQARGGPEQSSPEAPRSADSIFEASEPPRFRPAGREFDEPPPNATPVPPFLENQRTAPLLAPLEVDSSRPPSEAPREPERSVSPQEPVYAIGLPEPPLEPLEFPPVAPVPAGGAHPSFEEPKAPDGAVPKAQVKVAPVAATRIESLPPLPVAFPVPPPFQLLDFETPEETRERQVAQAPAPVEEATARIEVPAESQSDRAGNVRPMTAAKASIIGPIEPPRRSSTLFGMRRR